jgi:hypothetical protein
MSTIIIVIAIILGVALAGLLVAFRSRYRDLFSVAFVLGVAALAVAITILRIDQYRSDQAAATAFATRSAPPSIPAAAPVPPGPQPQAPISLPSYGPMVRPPTGGAAPAAVPNPYTGRSS